MDEERIEMSQEERDRLHWLKLTREKKITQKVAAERMGVSARWVRKLLRKLKCNGDRAVVHGLRKRPSNRKIAEAVRQRAIELVRSEYRDFGPTLEYYTDKAGLFQVNRPLHYNKRLEETPPLTQIGRALKELGVGWTAAQSPQAKGRIERFFRTAQDRLVKGLRKAGAGTRQA